MKLNELEQRALNLNHIIIGMDEVGRGAWINPIVFGIVIIENINNINPAVKDSKKISPVTRKVLAAAIKWAHGKSHIFQYDCKNSLVEGYKALDGYLAQIIGSPVKPVTLFLDAGINQYLKITKIRINNIYESVKGDSIYYSVAAASIIAKDFRDQLVAQTDLEIYNGKYNWSGNKGYINKDHKKRVKKHGMSQYHRTFFNIKV